jgi:hypothetical protein
MAKVKSLRFDARATLTLPQAVADQLRAKVGSQAGFLGSGSTVQLTISGAAARPGQFDATIQATVGSLTVNSELLAAGGSVYLKNPMTNKWQLLKQHQAAAQPMSKSGLSYQSVVDTAKSLTEIKDQPSTLDGASVDHYRVVPDLVRLLALASAGHTTTNSQTTTAIKDLLQNATVVADVWTGSSDHLVRRLSYDASIDLHALSALLSSAATGQTFNLPAGSTAHLTAVLNLHDFNANIKIQAPTVTP